MRCHVRQVNAKKKKKAEKKSKGGKGGKGRPSGGKASRGKR
jgi:hypothetical protein